MGRVARESSPFFIPEYLIINKLYPFMLAIQAFLCNFTFVIQKCLKRCMDNSTRNVFIGALITVAMAVIGSWVQLNARIAVLEVQVQANRDMMTKYDSDMSIIKNSLNDINVKLARLQEGKADKHD